MKKVYIVGVGLGNAAYLTKEAYDILVNAKKVYTTARIGEGLKTILKAVVSFKVSEIVDIIESCDEDVVIMVSGDTGFYSLANTIAKRLPQGEAKLIRVNGISSMQYLFAKIGKSYEDVKLVSLHGRAGNIVSYVNYNAKVFALTGGKSKVADICESLYKANMNFVHVTVGENLGNVDNIEINAENLEKIYTLSPKQIIERDKLDEISALSVLYIENPRAVNPHTMLGDRDLLRGDAPMTKEEIRHISVAKLNILPQDIVYDIGAGTGSVSLEMAKKAYESTVYAIEQKQEAYDLLEQNKEQLGIYNVRSILAKAPEGMADLPAPNKVFIGGSGKNMGLIIDAIIEKAQREFENEDTSFEHSNAAGGTAHRQKQEAQTSESSVLREVRFVINTIAIESLAEANQIFADPKFEDVDYISISAAKSKKVGPYHMMMANNPIYIITATYRIRI